MTRTPRECWAATAAGRLITSTCMGAWTSRWVRCQKLSARWRLCVRLARPDRVSLSPRASVPVFDLASAFGRGYLHRRVPGAGGRARTHREAVGEHALLQA